MLKRPMTFHRWPRLFKSNKLVNIFVNLVDCLNCNFDSKRRKKKRKIQKKEIKIKSKVIPCSTGHIQNFLAVFLSEQIAEPLLILSSSCLLGSNVEFPYPGCFSISILVRQTFCCDSKGPGSVHTVYHGDFFNISQFVKMLVTMISLIITVFHSCLNTARQDWHVLQRKACWDLLTYC